MFLQTGKKKGGIRKNKSLFESVSARIIFWSFLVGTSEKPWYTLLSHVYENLGFVLVGHEKTNLDLDSKSVCEQSHMGSNPILSAKKSSKLKSFLDFSFRAETAVMMQRFCEALEK